MKIFLLLICISVLGIGKIDAQNLPVLFNHNATEYHVTGLNISFENTLYIAFNYDRIISFKGRNASIGVALESPIYLLADRNKRITLNSSVYLLPNKFTFRTQFSLSTNFYEDALSKGHFMDFSLGVFPGYYLPKYFIASEISFTNNIFTTFNFKEISPIQGNLVLTNTTGSFNFGLQGGILLKERFEVVTRLYYAMPRSFKNHPPFTQNIGFSLGTNYRF